MPFWPFDPARFLQVHFSKHMKLFTVPYPSIQDNDPRAPVHTEGLPELHSCMKTSWGQAVFRVLSLRILLALGQEERILQMCFFDDGTSW